jgi:hypothetical protein
MCRQFPNALRIDSFLELQAWCRAADTQPGLLDLALVRVEAFYDCHQESQGRRCLLSDLGCEGPPLRENWSTTTDALAARLGCLTGAREVILLKSCHLDAKLGLAQAARLGIVDQQLPEFEGRVAIRLEHLK